MNAENTQNLKDKIEIFDSHISQSEKKIYGDGYGDISLRGQIEKYIEDISNKNKIVLNVLDFLTDEVGREYSQALEEINRQFTQLIGYKPEDFIRNSQGHISNITQSYERIFKMWGSIFAVYQQHYPNELSKVVENLKSRLGDVDQSVTKATNAAKASLETVQGISFIEVQKIWRESKNGMAIKMLVNAMLLGIAIYIFLKYAFCFLKEVDTLEDAWTWKIAYLASIRFVILGFLIAIVHFLVNTLRSYLHLYESSLHKLNVTNAIPVFHNSVADTEKDKVFFRLLDSLMSFNETGFLKSDFKDPTSNFPSIHLNDKKSD